MTLQPALSVRPSVGPVLLFSCGHATLKEALSVRWSVLIELKSGKTRISAPAHPSATDGRVSGLVDIVFLPLITEI